MPYLFRFLYTFASVSLLIPIYAINRQVPLATLLGINTTVDLPNWISYCILAAIPFIFTLLVCCVKKRLNKQCLDYDDITRIEPAGSDQIPVALGYVFIALSISNSIALVFCLLILSILCFFTPTYFNVILYLFGYQYYYVTVNNKVRVLIATKKSIRLYDKVCFPELRKINEITYIDNENE